MPNRKTTAIKTLVLTVITDLIMVWALIQLHRRRRYFVEVNTKAGLLTGMRMFCEHERDVVKVSLWR